MSLYPTCLETYIVTLSNDLLKTYYKPLHIHNSDIDIAKIDILQNNCSTEYQGQCMIKIFEKHW